MAAVEATAATVEAAAAAEVAEVLAAVPEVASTPAKSSARTNRSKRLQPALRAASPHTAARSPIDRAEAWLSASFASFASFALTSSPVHLAHWNYFAAGGAGGQIDACPIGKRWPKRWAAHLFATFLDLLKRWPKRWAAHLFATFSYREKVAEKVACPPLATFLNLLSTRHAGACTVLHTLRTHLLVPLDDSGQGWI